MKNLILILLVSGIALSFSSCKKDEVAAKSKTDIISAKPWVIAQADFDTGLFPLTVYKQNVTTNVLDASKISLTFKSDGTIQATDLQGKGISGTWAFNADETKITLPPGLPFSEVVITTLTETNLDVTVPSFSANVLGTVAVGKLTVKMIPKV